MYDYTNNDTKNIKLHRRADLPEIGTYLEPLKLLVASKDAGESKLPKGFTVTQVIADYLQEIGARIMHRLHTKYGDDITMADVQWCVTVPSNWDDRAMKQMQVCLARSGIV